MVGMSLPAATRPRLFPDDLDVVAYIGLRLRDEPDLPHPCFGDDVWDLSAVADIPAASRFPGVRVDWSGITQPVWRLCAKEVAIGLLQPLVGLEHRIPRARRSPLPVQDLRPHVNMWKAWFGWLNEHGVDRLADVTQAHCDAWLAGRPRSAVASEVTAIRRFDDYRLLVSHDSYREGFRPWAAKSAAAVGGGSRRGENRTPVIPDEVFGPVLAGALFLVQVAGPDVVAARAEWIGLQSRVPQPNVDANLASYLDGLRRDGRSLPELHQRHIEHQRARGVFDDEDPLRLVNLRLVERHISTYGGALRKGSRRAVVEQALADVGCGPGGGLNTVPAIVSDPPEPSRSRPWHPGFSPYDLDDLANLVMTACYVVVVALSGLRRSELAEMRRGCVHPEQLADGRFRYRIEARMIKGRSFGGEVQHWTVIEEVAQAFALVERLVEDDLPFARIQPSVRYPTLIRWINGEGARSFLTPVPTEWRFADRQFRRTLARLLGFRPHGVLAGKVHLKHVSVATSEGYYGKPGSSAAAFLAEVERERVRARMETTTRLYGEWVAGAPLAGPGRAELAALFTSVRQELAGSHVSVVATDHRIEELLRRRAATLHVGPLNHCWFVDPTRARCLQAAGQATATAPLIGMCEPTHCANATIHPEHSAVWLDTRRHLDRLLANPRVPAQERARLTPERSRVDRVVRATAGDVT